MGLYRDHPGGKASDGGQMSYRGYQGPRKDRVARSLLEPIPRKLSGDQGQRIEERFRAAAEDLLENVLMRRRWAVDDRDRVAEFLRLLVEAEKRGKK